MANICLVIIYDKFIRNTGKDIYLLLLLSQSLFILEDFSSMSGKQTFLQEVCEPNNKCQV